MTREDSLAPPGPEYRPRPLMSFSASTHSLTRSTVLASLLGLCACGGTTDPAPIEPSPPQTPSASAEDTLARDRAAAMAANTRYDQARSVLAPLVIRANAQVEDLLRAAVIEIQEGQLDAAAEFLRRAENSGGESDAAMHYLLGRLAQLQGTGDAESSYRRALELAPEDPASQYVLAQVLEQSDRFDEALALCEQTKAAGIEQGGPWYVSSIYLLFRIHNWLGEDAEAVRKYTDLWSALQQRGLRAVKEAEINEGTLARVLPPQAIGNRPGTEVTAPSYEHEGIILTELGGGSELVAEDLDGDRQTDLVSAGTNGVFVALRTQEGSWETQQVFSGSAHHLRAIDLHKDGTLDLVFISEGGLAMLEAEQAASSLRWVPTPLKWPVLRGALTDLELVDSDHDGDLDLFLAGTQGLHLLRNDGAGRAPEAEGDETGSEQDQTPTPRGQFTDVSADTELPTSPGWSWCCIEDLDGDQDVDLVGGGDGRLWVGSSLRAGRFEDVSPIMFPGENLPSQPLFADVDGDARPDAICPAEAGGKGRLFLQQASGRMLSQDRTIPEGAHLIETDIDLDGSVDVLWASPSHAAEGLARLGLPGEKGIQLGTSEATGPLTVCDLESGYGGVLSYELLRLEKDGVHVSRCTSPIGNGMRIRFRGKKDNRQGIGAVVELRTGSLYRRHFWRGESTLYGLGDAEFFEVLRVTWPNGVVTSDLDVEAGNQILEGSSGLGIQTEGLIGSCPFLYTWNGHTFEFITDVLGITPLGLPMAPGMLVPPDHDEYVLIGGDLLVEQEGVFRMQFTEELREVTYLDEVRLDVVDHPIGTQVQPNERFTFPPFPEAHTHVMQTLLGPSLAMGSDGNDWTDSLQSIDAHHAAPFERLEDGQFYGLAAPHWLELQFDREALLAAGPDARLRLVCTGWFLWTDASVNMASARTPGVEFVPPVLSIPQGNDWVPIGPPVGFPAGKTKTMVLDVGEWFERDDPRLRISSTLCLYWDSIRLAVGDDEPQRTVSLPPTSARLWARGFSRPIPDRHPTEPERFDWDAISEEARWDQHPGNYTRYGEVLPLVTSTDDRFAILGSGDALELRFDASGLPPVPEGWTRDYLLFLDGWAKDRDPNTLSALTVKPLPHHGMGIYPPPPGAEYPTGPEDQAWQDEWNTRPAYRHIIPLSPRRERDWSR